MMRWLLLLPALVVAVLAWSPAARASSDYSCAPTWKPLHLGFSDCDNMAMLTPANDTRVNLLLLTRALNPRELAPPEKPDEALFDWGDYAVRIVAPNPVETPGQYSYSDASRCNSATDGAAAFERALRAARGVPASEVEALVAARRALKPACEGAPPVAPSALALSSPAGRAYGAYLAGATAFYAAQFDGARAAFMGLRGNRDGWLEESGAYMLGRVELNRAQTGAFDEWGTYKGSDAIGETALAAAQADFRAYLRAYPQGRYADSAQGLLRRVDWLAGRTDRLAAEYARLMAVPEERRSIDDGELAQEIDNKLLLDAKAGTITDPRLLAVVDLKRMRLGIVDPYGTASAAVPMTRAELEAQRPAFAGQLALFDLLRATHALHIGKQPAEVLRLIPDAPVTDTLSFSRQMLRANALKATGDAGTRAALLRILPQATRPFERPAVELAVAWHDERAGALGRVFADGSPVRNERLRAILLTNVAGPDLLRARATDARTPARERALALFTLLYKQVTRGRYADFVRDVALVPAGAPATTQYELIGTEPAPTGLFTGTRTGEYGCPPLPQTATKLATVPGEARALLCLADWVRANDLDGFVLDRQPAADELGGTASLFPGKPFSRLDVYQRILAGKAGSPDDMAYALYRAVRCYAPSGNNSCTGTDVPQSTRRAWFQRLKRDYPQSRWARDLPYYW